MDADERKLSIEEIKEALEKEWFTVFLQPKFNLVTETVCGSEALVRIQHPKRGCIMPEEFIACMEKGEMLIALDRYVLEHTCGILRGWMEKGKKPYPISVNLSMMTFMRPDLSSALKRLLEKYKIPSSYLQLEMTEKMYHDQPNTMQNAVCNLHTAGFFVIMDDFGSGQFSINTIKNLPIDAIKLDMNLFPLVENFDNDEIVLSSVIRMANWLGISVIAENVENRRQKDFLQGAGCDFIQGYFMSDVIPQKSFEEQYVFSGEGNLEEEDKCDSKILPKHNLTLLVVDDEESSREILQEIFQSLYHVHKCDSAEAALAYLKKNKNRVRLILIDKFMPGMSGIEFLRYCKQDESLSMIPQIMITVDQDEQSQVEAFREGAYDYITKPYRREIVSARVNHVMDLSCRTSIFDIIEQKYKQKPELDPATSLLNKVAFSDLSIRMMESFAHEQMALMVIDIDDFKMVNDRYGHLMGDKIIRCVADELTNAVRKTDLVGRFGGDEFVIFVAKIQSRETARLKALEIIKEVMVNCIRKYNISISVSVGLAFSESGDTFDRLFERSDQALYTAKESGKGRVVVHGEKIPSIEIDDQRPVILIHSQSEQVFSTIALTYGESAGFVLVKDSDELMQAFERYSKNISVVCIDMQEHVMDTSDFIYQYLLQQNNRRYVPLVAICKDGDMLRLKGALQLKLRDILMLPPQIGAIERILSKSVMEAANSNNTG